MQCAAPTAASGRRVHRDRGINASRTRASVEFPELDHRRELAETFGAITRQWQSAELLDALEKAGIPSGPINTYPEVFADPQVVHRGMTIVARARAGRADHILCESDPLHRGGATHSHGAPLLGQHTEEVLRQEPLMPLTGSAPATSRNAGENRV